MSTTIEAYRLLFNCIDTISEPKRISHKIKEVEELIKNAVKQEAINLIPTMTKMWSVDFKGSTTRVYNDGLAYTLEINPVHFDKLDEDSKAFIILRELEKMRLGYVKPDVFTELTEEQQINLDLYASDIVTPNLARKTLNTLALYAAKDIHKLKPRPGILNRLMYGYNGYTCPRWVAERELDFNMYIGAVTEVMKDAAPEQLEKFHFNARLKVMNELSGYRRTQLNATIHAGYDVGELSYMDVSA